MVRPEAGPLKCTGLPAPQKCALGGGSWKLNPLFFPIMCLATPEGGRPRLITNQQHLATPGGCLLAVEGRHSGATDTCKGELYKETHINKSPSGAPREHLFQGQTVFARAPLFGTEPPRTRVPAERF